MVFIPTNPLRLRCPQMVVKSVLDNPVSIDHRLVLNQVIVSAHFEYAPINNHDYPIGSVETSFSMSDCDAVPYVSCKL